MAVTIPIIVLRADEAAGNRRRGTFESPHPLVRVHVGTQIKWVLAGSGTFKVLFQGLSPFADSVITDATPRTATNVGHYHYSISVTDGGETWTISGCPELDVGTP